MNNEYIRLKFDFGDLAQMNRLGSVGWRVITVQPAVGSGDRYSFWALMERSHEALPLQRDGGE